MQSEALVELLIMILPAGHREHTLDPSTENVPELQLVHTDAKPTEYVPDTQLAHFLHVEFGHEM